MSDAPTNRAPDSASEGSPASAATAGDAAGHAASMASVSDASLGRRIFAMAWPNVLYAILDATLSLVDMGLAGHVGDGKSAMAAVGLCTQLLFVVLVVAIAVPSGAVPIVGQAWAKGDVNKVARVGRQVILCMLVFGTVLGMIYWVGGPTGLRLLGAPEAVYTQGVAYIRTLSYGIMLMLLNFAMVSLFRGIGQVRTPLVLAVMVNLINLAVSAALVIGIPGLVPSLGIRGAAIGTIAGRLCGAIFLVVIWRRRMRQAGATLPTSWLFDRETLAPILRIGSAIGGMHLIRVSSQLIFIALLTLAAKRVEDTAALAAGMIVYRFRFMMIVASISIQVSLITLVSHSLGVDDFALAKRFTRRTLVYGTGFIGIFAVLLTVFAAPMMQFVAVLSEPATADAIAASGTPMLRINMVAQIFVTAGIIIGGALFGGGDTKWPFLFTLFTEWFVMLPIAWLAVFVLHWPIYWIWSGFVVSAVLMLGLVVGRYRQGVWMRRL